jgi:hypothetical protein
MSTSPTPRRWTRNELEVQRALAIDRFVTWWKQTGNTAYQAHYQKALTTVTRLIDNTDNLLSFGTSVLQQHDRDMRDMARYLAGPPLSEDDLLVLAGSGKATDPAYLEKLVRVITSVLDPLRFPWLFEKQGPQQPSRIERGIALQWTAGLLAAQRAATERRTGASYRQEQAVEQALSHPSLAFQKVKPRPIVSARDFLQAGEFCRQSEVGGTRSDFTIGLRSKLLVVECKVSNSEVNSYKRLIHEVGNKAGRWKTAFGEGIIPAAVLDGVLKLDNLVKAQEMGITIFWERDLQPLIEFVASAR